MICVQLADSTIQYLEGIVHNLLVQVKDTFIVADFVILDMEGELGISLWATISVRCQSNH